MVSLRLGNEARTESMIARRTTTTAAAVAMRLFFFCGSAAITPNQKRIERRHEERNAVNPGEGGELHQRGISRGGIAQQVPREN